MSDQKRPVSAVDSLWLHMDTPENLMVIEGIMTFSEPLDFDRAVQVIKHRIPDRYPVFRQMPVPSQNPLGGGDYWVDDPDFDLANHIHVLELPAGSGDRALQELVSEQMSRPIPRDRPLWQAFFINGYKGGTALLSRFHHSMADGTALARVLLELTDDDPDGDLVEAARLREGGANQGQTHDLGQAPHSRIGARVDSLLGGEPEGRRSRFISAVESATESVAGPFVDRTKGAAATARKLTNPDAVNDAIAIARRTPTILDKLLVWQLPDNPIRGQVGVRKVAAWSQPYDLSEIKVTARAHGATVNDVMVAGIAGALRQYTLEEGGTPQDMATMVPVNLRPLDKPLPRELGNRFALVVLKLPLSGETPAARLAMTKAAMDDIKSSPEALVTFGIIETLGAINATVTKNMVSFFSGKGIGVTTNVIGPRNERYFAGEPVQSVIGWAPSAGAQTLNECIFSFDDRIQVGFKSDFAAIPQPQRLVDAFDHEIFELMRTTQR
ncbi:MAG: DUF1298 domain-containing protein [Actinobacteria bacterium]|nr:DUF1298 domain-containing protein [Actinomycetota bacterium]